MTAVNGSGQLQAILEVRKSAGGVEGVWGCVCVGGVMRVMGMV